MKSNYAKYLLVAVSGIAGLFTATNVNAFTIQQITERMGGTDYINACSNGYKGYYNSTISADSSGHVYLNNIDYVCNGEIFPYTYFSYDWSRNSNAYLDTSIINNGGHQFVMKFPEGMRGFSYVQARSYGTQTAFMLWSPRWSDWQTYLTNSTDSYTQTINGQSVDFDQVILWHDTFILLKDIGGRYITKQFIGDFVLDNYILYVDIADQNRNVWLINIYDGKAWSVKMDLTTANYLMFGLQPVDNPVVDDPVLLTWDYIKDITWTNGYYITTGYNLSLPPTAGNHDQQQSFIGFQYIQDANWEQPEFNDSESGSGEDFNALSNYEQCVYDFNYIKAMGIYQNQCENDVDTYNDFSQLYQFVVNYTGYGEFTGNAVMSKRSCKNYYDYAMKFYIDSSPYDAYLSGLQVANLMSVDPSSYQVETYCGSRPSAVSEQSWACRVLGIGCSDNSSIFQDVYSKIQTPFVYLYDQYYGPLEDSFMSGYNYFNVPACEVDFYGKSYPWGNYLLIFVSFVLVFIFYSML